VGFGYELWALIVETLNEVIMRSRLYMTSLVLAAVVLAPSWAHAQRGRAVAVNAGSFTVMNVDTPEDVPTITGAPFTADATTEFTQLLSDGNRIERRSSTTLARDGRGRTRREQEMTMVGPLTIMLNDLKVSRGGTSVDLDAKLALAGGGRGGRGFGPGQAADPTPRFVVITDPVERVSYTVDDQRKEARLSPMAAMYFKRDAGAIELAEHKKLEAALAKKGQAIEQLQAQHPDVVTATSANVESLGTRQIEGVTATGVRTTTTIPAGQIGNLLPINLVTERWFSEELGMAVLITRQDPRSGDTTYRLTNIIRNEPPPDLFTVPSDYRIIDQRKPKLDDSKIHLEEMRKLVDKFKKVSEAAPEP
jgi:hypothetical protein